MTQSTIAKRQFDVAIFVATEDEHEAVLQDNQWNLGVDATVGPMHVRLLRTEGDFIIRLVLRRLPLMGAEACALHVSRLLTNVG